jgi:hypothetical protein
MPELLRNVNNLVARSDASLLPVRFFGNHTLLSADTDLKRKIKSEKSKFWAKVEAHVDDYRDITLQHEDKRDRDRRRLKTRVTKGK